MSCKMSREAYEQIIGEDLEWLLKQPRSLERMHIEDILRQSPDDQYLDRERPEIRPSESARELVKTLWDDCTEAGQEGQPVINLDQAAALIEADRKRERKKAAERHCHECAVDCEDGVICAPGHKCSEWRAILG